MRFAQLFFQEKGLLVQLFSNAILEYPYRYMKKIALIFTLSFASLAFAEENIRNLHQEAERAMQEKEYKKAQAAYEKIVHQLSSTAQTQSKTPIDWPCYVDVTLRLSLLYQNNEEFEKGEELLQSLADQNLAPELHSQILIQLARLKCSHNAPEEAFKIFNQVKEILPIEKWRGQDRSFYLGLEAMLNAHYDSFLKKAELYFHAKHYEEAIPLYEMALSGIENALYSASSPPLEKQLRYRLAECSFLKSQYDKALSLVEELNLQEGDIEKETLYLRALVYRERNELEKAVDDFQKYLSGKNKKQLPHFSEALYELGHIYYNENNFTKARNYFERVVKYNANDKSTILAKLYISRIFLNEKEYARADEQLNELVATLLPNHPLLYEAHYLKGTSAFELNLYEKAVLHFEKALPIKVISKDGYNSPWAPLALYQMGISYLKLAELEKKTERQDLFFGKARELFSSLEESHLREDALLALGELFLLKISLQGCEEAREELVHTLGPLWGSFSIQGQFNALLLLAVGASDYQEKSRYYAMAEAPDYSECPNHANGCYYEGLNHFQEGIKRPEEGELYFERATHCFEKAFSLFENLDKKKAASILKLEAEAKYFLDTKPSLLSSLETLEKLLQQYSTLYLPLHDQAETLYLRGLVASRLAAMDEKEEYLSLAEESLKGVISLAPEKECAGNALNVLATLYSQKENWEKAYGHFEELAQNYPLNSHAAKAWFALAEIGERISLPKEKLTAFKENVYTLYPHSPYAPDAYFHLYPLEEYERGDPKAMKHLLSFHERFSNSPLVIATYYFLGMDAKRHQNSSLAKEIFAKGIETYEKTEERLRASLANFRTRSLLETGRILVEEKKEEGINLLLDLVEAQNKTISETKSYLPTYQECSVALIQALIQCKKFRLASLKFTTALNHFHLCGIQNGYYLAKIWQLGALIAVEKEEYKTALECLKVAEGTGAQHLPLAEVLELWMSEATCYQGLGQYYLAMRTLSKIINEDIACPLRVEAMYNRAVLYQLQGREELAVRQLEACAKKGGRWGEKAQQTLRSQYGMHASRSWIHYE